MSKLCYFDVSGWLEDGMPLPTENKQEVIDILEELIADDFKQDLSEGSAQVMRFSTEYEFAPEEVQEACSKYAKAHPRIILEIEYSDHDEEVFQRIRFKGNWCEHRDAAYHFMPFEVITIPKEQPPLPVIEFTYGSVETEDAFSLMVLLGRTLSLKKLDSLEDSVASYAEDKAKMLAMEAVHLESLEAIIRIPRIPQEYTVGPASWAGFVCKFFVSAPPGFQFPWNSPDLSCTACTACNPCNSCIPCTDRIPYSRCIIRCGLGK